MRVGNVRGAGMRLQVSIFNQSEYYQSLPYLSSKMGIAPSRSFALSRFF